MTVPGAAATAAPQRSACRCCSWAGGGPGHGPCDSLDVLSVIGMQVPAVRNKVMLRGGLPHATLVRLPAAAVRESCDRVSAHTRHVSWKQDRPDWVLKAHPSQPHLRAYSGGLVETTIRRCRRNPADQGAANARADHPE
jgi:hypothetical protein